MTPKTMVDILSDFSASAPSSAMGSTNRRPITIWLRPEDKERYDHLQEVSGRRFSKKAREALLQLIEVAEARLA